MQVSTWFVYQLNMLDKRRVGETKSNGDQQGRNNAEERNKVDYQPEILPMGNK